MRASEGDVTAQGVGSATDTKFSRQRQYTPEQQAAIDQGQFGAKKGPGLSSTAVKDALRKAKLKLRQGIVDQFDSFKSILEDNRTWMMAQLSRADSGAFEAVIHHGAPEMVDGAISIQAGSKGLGDILAPLGEEADDFLRWIAGNRADRLRGESRERLFDAAQIAALKSLNEGKMADGRDRGKVYESVRQEFEALADAVVGVAVETGLINEEQREQWKEEGFYVPFYRLSESDTAAVRGPGISTGLAKQRAYKKLKGADIPLNDLLTNVLLNWHHLIGASLRNQAAVRAVKAAQELGLAESISSAGKSKNAIWVNENGHQQWYEFGQSDEAALVLDSLLSLSWEGLNNAGMKVARQFKRALTIGVTTNPEFRVANLLRDSIHSIAVAPMSVNIVKNIASGWRGTKKGSETQVAMAAGGGSFGTSGYIDGNDPETVKRLVKKGVDEDTVLTTGKRLAKVWDKYQEWGARSENINRAAAFQAALDEGQDLLTANFEARDLLDFSRTGSFVAVRAIAQTVPFFNARLQGLDKMARALASKKQRAQFATVAGVYAMASALLYLAMKDDPDYEEAEDWEKDAYPLFKLPGSDVMYRFPRPFEVGTIAVVMERITEQAVDDEAHGALFAERLWHALTETLSFNPIPQIVKPAIEIFANRNMFTGNRIESMSMERLSPKERKHAWTSETTITLSKAMDIGAWGKVVLSPVQIEYLVRGYLGWAGSFVMGSVDTLFTRPFTGDPIDPAKRFYESPVMKRFVRDNPTRHSKYVSTFYDQLRSVNQVYADIKQAGKLGEYDKVDKLAGRHGDKLATRKHMNRIAKKLSETNARMTLIYADRDMTAQEKRTEIDALLAYRNELTRDIVTDTRKFFR